MEELFGRYAVIAFGAIFASLFTGFFAFMNLVVSKEQKVSEFRQEWINSLRDSISSYISALAYLSILYKHYSAKNSGEKDKFEMAKGVEEVYVKVNESYNDIVFRINDNESDPKGKEINDEFLSALYKTRELYNESKYDASRSACDELRDKTKPLLKFEWKRVKTGESNYKLAKSASIMVIALGISLSILTGVLIWNANSHINNDTSTAIVPVSKKKVKVKVDKELQVNSGFTENTADDSIVSDAISINGQVISNENGITLVEISGLK